MQSIEIYRNKTLTEAWPMRTQMATMQALRARLRETEEMLEAGLEVEDAELMAARYVDAATATAGGAQAGSGGSGDATDEEIDQAVKVGKCTGFCRPYGGLYVCQALWLIFAWSVDE